MAVWNVGWTFPVILAQDALNDTDQYLAVNVSGAFTAVANDFFGILQNKGKTGEHCTAMFNGISKWRITGVNAAGQLVAATTSGWCTVVGSSTGADVGSGTRFNGRIVFAASSGGFATVELFQGFNAYK